MVEQSVPWLKVFFQKATKDTIYTITSMNLTANNLTDLMDRSGPSNSTEVQKGANVGRGNILGTGDCTDV